MKKFIPIIIAVIVAGGLGFGGGTLLAKGRATRGQFVQFNGMGGMRTGARVGGMGGNGGAVAGEILSKDDKSITVKLRDGGSKTVYLSDKTQIMKSAAGSTADLVVGGDVSVFGAANSDGSVSAQSVQLRPAQASKQ